MKLALADRPDPFLRRRAAVIEGGGGWHDAEGLLAAAGVAVGGAPAPGEGALSRLLSVIHGLDAGTRAGIEARLERTDATDQPAAFHAPLDADRKLIVTAGRESLSRSNTRGPAEMVVGFSKFPTAFGDPGGDVPLPAGGGRFDADAALGVVLGAPAYRVAPVDALDRVVGYTLLVDVVDRDMSDEEQRTNNSLFARNRPGLSLLGPCIWIPGRGGFDGATEITLSVNGAERQRFCLDDLAHGVGDAIAAWSRAGLDAGDIIGLGAAIARPRAGVPLDSPVAIAPGDKIAVACGPIGALEARFVAGSDG